MAYPYKSCRKNRAGNPELAGFFPLEGVALAEKFFAHDISQATCIKYEYDRTLVGFQLNGSSDGMMLDGLPGL